MVRGPQGAGQHHQLVALPVCVSALTVRQESSDADHARIRKLVAHAFSDAALREQESLLTGHTSNLMNKLKQITDGPEKGRVNIMDYYNFLTFDVIGDLCLGESFGAIESGEYDTWIVQIFQGLKFWRVLRLGNAYPLIGLFFKLLMATIPSVEAMRDSFFKIPKAKVERRLATKTDRKDFMSYVRTRWLVNVCSQAVDSALQ